MADRPIPFIDHLWRTFFLVWWPCSAVSMIQLSGSQRAGDQCCARNALFNGLNYIQHICSKISSFPHATGSNLLKAFLLESFEDKFCFHFVCQQGVFHHIDKRNPAWLFGYSSNEIFTHTAIENCRVKWIIVILLETQLNRKVIHSVEFWNHSVKLPLIGKGNVGQPRIGLIEIFCRSNNSGSARRRQPHSVCVYALES